MRGETPVVEVRMRVLKGLLIAPMPHGLADMGEFFQEEEDAFDVDGSAGVVYIHHGMRPTNMAIISQVSLADMDVCTLGQFLHNFS